MNTEIRNINKFIEGRIDIVRNNQHNKNNINVKNKHVSDAVERIISEDFDFITDAIKKYKDLTEVTMFEYGKIVLKYGDMKKIIKVNKFNDEGYINNLFDSIASATDNHFNDKFPHMITTIPIKGWRIACMRPPDSDKYYFSIRIPSKKIYSLSDFINNKKTIDKLIKIVSKINNDSTILISGGTSTGKTSFLNALLQYIPKNRRIISVENMQELRIKSEEWAKMVFSESVNKINANNESVSPYQLALDQINRADPDLVIFGEITLKSSEYWFRTTNIGKMVIGTIHGNDPRGAIDALRQNISLSTGSDINSYSNDFVSSYIKYIVQLRANRVNNKKVERNAFIYKYDNQLKNYKEL